MADSSEKSAEQDKWERTPGYVYFILAGEPPVAVKIGVTVKHGLKNRLRSHQSSNHEPLRIFRLVEFEGMERPMLEAEELEKKLHMEHSDLQRFEPGWAGHEWFTVNPALLKDLSNYGVEPEQLGEPKSIARPQETSDA